MRNGADNSGEGWETRTESVGATKHGAKEREIGRPARLLLEFHKGPLSCNRYQLRTQTTSEVLIFFFPPRCNGRSLARFTFTPFKLSQ